MAYTALTCTNPACSARGEIQTSKACVVCGKPTSWAVARGGPVLVSPYAGGPATTDAHRPPGAETRTCVTEGCPRFHLAQDDPFCGECGNPTVVARAR